MSLLKGVRATQQYSNQKSANEILMEWYHSFILTKSTMIREDISELKARVLYAELDPRYCDSLNPVCKHDGAWHIYCLSFGAAPPLECIPVDESKPCELTGEHGPMACTSNQRIAEMINKSYYWVQNMGPDGSNGRLTPQTDDNWFHRLNQAVKVE
jgi:hypothetical protein